MRCHPLLEGVARQANVEFRLLCRRCYSDIRSVYYVGGEALIAERTVIFDPAITGRGEWTKFRVVLIEDLLVVPGQDGLQVRSGAIGKL